MADAHLTEWFENLPARMVFQPGGQLRMNVQRAIDIGAVKRIVAGAEAVHILIDIRRPYNRPIMISRPEGV